MKLKKKQKRARRKSENKIIRKELIEKKEGFEYYKVYYENGKSNMEVVLVQPSWYEQSYCERMPRLCF